MNSMISKNHFTYDEILRAYFQCRKHKRNTKLALKFEVNFPDKLQKLLKQINTKTYKADRYHCFAVLNPKPREVWAAPFEDRIVHHLIYNEIQPEFEKHFIDQSYSCIKNRGTTKCIKDVFKGIRKITKNYQEDAFYIKLDIQNFFVSINKEILWDIIKEKVDENSLLGYLIKQNIFQDIISSAEKFTLEKLKKVPAYKSLFNVNNSKQGLPIGNLTSQFFSNIYLDAFDHFCKHNLKLKYYYRYADDILILIKDKKLTKNIISSINNWLIENRKLKINPKKIIINRLRLGVKYLGARLFFYYIIPSNLIFEKLKYTKKLFQKDIFNKKILSSFNSYLGFNSQFNIYNFSKNFMNKCQLPFIYNNEVEKIFYI